MLNKLRNIKMSEVHERTMKTLNKLTKKLPMNIKEKTLNRLNEAEGFLNENEFIDDKCMEKVQKQMNLSRKMLNSKLYNVLDKANTGLFKVVDLAIKAVSVPFLDGFNLTRAIFSK